MIHSRCPDPRADECQSCHNPEGPGDWSGDWQRADSVRVLRQLCWPGWIIWSFSFLFLWLRNVCTPLWFFFFCFVFLLGFLMVCALAWFAGVDQIMLLFSLSQQDKDEWRRKSSAFHLQCTRGWVLTCWAVPAACWYRSVHGLSAGKFTLLTGRSLLWLLGSQALLSRFPHEKFICFYSLVYVFSARKYTWQLQFLS